MAGTFPENSLFDTLCSPVLVTRVLIATACLKWASWKCSVNSPESNCTYPPICGHPKVVRATVIQNEFEVNHPIITHLEQGSFPWVRGRSCSARLVRLLFPGPCDVASSWLPAHTFYSLTDIRISILLVFISTLLVFTSALLVFISASICQLTSMQLVVF